MEGRDCVDTERAARAYARANGACYISPYNDPQVAGGQGTLAVELERQLGHVDAVFASLGGGGLIAGIGAHLRSWQPDAQMIACSPRASAVMHHSLQAGRILDLPSETTLSDGTAGGVEAGANTFELCQKVEDHRVLIEEPEIAKAMRMLIIDHHTMVEGAAGVALAGYLAFRDRYRGKRSVVVLCGANASHEVLRKVLQ